MGQEGARDQRRDVDLRQRYFDAIAQLEAGEARWAQLETSLRRVIGRLCLAGRGRAPALDNELRKMGELARGRADIATIDAALEPLSRAIAALDQISDGTGATTASRALPITNPAMGDAAAASASAVAPVVDNGAARHALLPSAVLSAPARVAGAAAGSESSSAEVSAVRAGAPTSPAAAADVSAAAERDTQVQAVIVTVLDRLARLPELRPALADLCERSKSSLSTEEFAEGLESIARLVGEQRATLMRERKEIEELLQQMDVRLGEITNYLAGDVAELQTAQTSTHQLDMLLMGEVRGLNTEVQSADDLGALRQRVRARLDIIAGHLQEFRSRESARVNAQLDRTQRMRLRVTDLEREIHGLHKSLQEEQSLRMIDALTGIPNRAAYDDRIRHEFTRWQRENHSVSVLAWDIDRFKEINDAYGHSAGDKVLRVIAQHLAQHVRGTDFVARYGGEEFVMILVGTDAAQAAQTADKIRVGIETMGFHFHNKPVAVTASCGITTFRGDDTPETIFDRADRALYRAKDGGRNCCRIL